MVLYKLCAQHGHSTQNAPHPRYSDKGIALARGSKDIVCFKIKKKTWGHPCISSMNRHNDRTRRSSELACLETNRRQVDHN